MQAKACYSGFIRLVLESMKEFDLIKLITDGTPKSASGLIFGVGDDCAVIEGSNGKDFLVTTDALFENIHFKLNWTSPKTLGRKALSVNISDVAAMGGRPLYYLATVGIPAGFPEGDILAVFDGMTQTAQSFRMTLIGGDTCKSDNGLLLSLTVIGEIDHGKAVYRKGALAGDLVYVTGLLGMSALGLTCLAKGRRTIDIREFIKRFEEPTPRISAGQWLSASTCVSSMIDISDGLISDLGHIAEESGVGMNIFADTLPLAHDFINAAAGVGKDALTLALAGGEDYELAFTVARNKIDLFEKMLKVVAPTFGHRFTKIGEVTNESGIKVVDIHGVDLPLSSVGFEHKF